MDTFAYKATSVFKRGVLFLYTTLVQPRSIDEDDRRREFILNVLLLACLGLAFVLFVIDIYGTLARPGSQEGFSPVTMFSILLIFVILLGLSRFGKFRFSAVLFVGLCMAPIFTLLIRWGADVPEGLLGCALIIIMSSVLMGTRLSLVLTGFVSLGLLAITYVEAHSIYIPARAWKLTSISMIDGIASVSTLLAVAAVSWLSNREIEKSLIRARASEKALREERDSLEVKVEERTRALRQLQIEKMSQLHHFVEFGRLASGFFHDLASPLTAISMNLQQFKANDHVEIGEAQAYVDRAFNTTKRLEGFLLAVRKQMQHQETNALFSLTEEIEYAVQVLGHKAKKAQVELLFAPPRMSCQTYGNPFKFNQVVTNLISNAIDAYEDYPVTTHPDRRVLIYLGVSRGTAKVAVRDLGKGISNENLKKIFEPFFTTKTVDRGMGIGLATTKDVVEHDFQGTIEVESQVGQGSVFTVLIPLRAQEV